MLQITGLATFGADSMTTVFTSTRQAISVIAESTAIATHRTTQAARPTTLAAFTAAGPETIEL